MLTPLPKDSGELLKACGLKGVVGEPNSCWGREMRPLACAGVFAMGIVFFLEGVSGIFRLLPKRLAGKSTLRFLFEIKPVDMKAVGRGLAIL